MAGEVRAMITATFWARNSAARPHNRCRILEVSTMSLRGFSQTAILPAICRAAHQMLDADPKILHDPIAVKFIDDAAQTALSNRDPTLMAMVIPAARTHFCLRS